MRRSASPETNRKTVYTNSSEKSQENVTDPPASLHAPGIVLFNPNGPPILRNRGVQGSTGASVTAMQLDSLNIEVGPCYAPQRLSSSVDDFVALVPSSPTVNSPGRTKIIANSTPKDTNSNTARAAGEGFARNTPSSKQTRQPMVQTIATLAVPISVSQVAQFSIMMFMLAAVGTIGVAELGGASIAFGLINATAFAFSSGLCGALETLLAQSFGQDPNSKQFGVYAQRMFFVLVLFTVPITLSLAFAEPFLLWIGEPANIAGLAGRFCRISSILTVTPVMLLELLRRYYATQRLPNPVFVTVVAAAVLNPFIVYPVVHTLGYDGVAIAFAGVTAAMDASLLLYLIGTGVYKQTWGGWTRAAFEQWGPLLRLALPSLAMGLCEWTCMETNSVIAGFGTEVELAAYAVSSQIVSLCWAVPSGVYMAATVLVGNSIGSGHPNLAKRYAAATSYLAIALALFNCVVVLSFSRVIGSLFTDDEAVLLLFTSRVAPSMAAYHLADTLSSNSLAILRGCGLHATGMLIVLSAIAVIGTPLGIFMFLHHHMGVEALWYGPLTGYLAVGLPALAYVLFRRIQWQDLKPSAEEVISAH